MFLDGKRCDGVELMSSFLVVDAQNIEHYIKAIKCYYSNNTLES